MKLTPVTALFLIACGTAAPSKSTDSASSSPTATDVGSASEAIRQLGKNDDDVVARCEDLVKGCEKFAADSGAIAAICTQLGEHCTELADQLSQARDQFQQCLEGVAACEASAANPADCRAQRAACNPAGKDFQDRRGATLACSERTQSCMPRMRGPGALPGMGRGNDDDADAGAKSCDGDPTDFVGCCHGHGGGEHFGGDAGAVRPGVPFGPGRGAGAAGPGAPGPRMTPGTPGDHRDDNNDADDADDTANGGSSGSNR